MYATVRRFEGVTDPGEAGRRVSEGWVPLVKEVPGFVAYYWVDAGNGVVVSTSVFEGQSEAEAQKTRLPGAREPRRPVPESSRGHDRRGCRLRVILVEAERSRL
jgi:hypothetical protein